MKENRLTPAQQLTQLREEINAILDKGIAQFLTPWADTETPIYIYIQGYTPDFNDGERCVHNSCEYDKDEIIDDKILENNSDLFGAITEQDIEDSADWPSDPLFKEAIDCVHEALEYNYGTDFHVLITLKDGQVSYIRDHYDCGF